MEEYIKKLQEAMSDFVLHADNEMGADEMAKMIAKVIKKAAYDCDLDDRRYLYHCISYYVQPNP